METIKVQFTGRIEEEAILLAAKCLRQGGLVAFPTETVYGLGADALNKEAVAGIFRAKGRPQDNPLIIHVADWNLEPYVTHVPEKAKALMERFWPGPLTVILPKTSLIPEETSAGLSSVGVRMPANETARRIIAALGHPVAAPSANLSGKPSPTNFDRCVEDLDGKVDMILGDGQSIVGLESTIVDYSIDPPRLLRPGFVTYEELLEVDGRILYEEALTRVGEKEAPRAPGMKYRHYAPKAPLTVIVGSPEKREEEMERRITEAVEQGKRVGILAAREQEGAYALQGVEFQSYGSAKNPAEIARNLFEALRRFDDLEVELIYAEGIDESGVGRAVMNRLKKAAGYRLIEV